MYSNEFISNSARSGVSTSETCTSEFINAISPIVTDLKGIMPVYDHKKRKFSRLTFNITRSYIKNKLNEIKLHGSHEADNLIDRLLPQSNDPYSKMLSDKINGKRLHIKRLICELAAKCDAASLAGFLTPFVYGGIVSAKNLTEESTKVIEFHQNCKVATQNELRSRCLRATDIIFKAKSIGLSIIAIRGRSEEIFSEEMCRYYRESPEQAFVLIEICDNIRVGGGMSAYEWGILERLKEVKNIFVLVEESKYSYKNDAISSNIPQNNLGEMQIGMSRNTAAAKLNALKCYKIPCGALAEGGSEAGASAEYHRLKDIMIAPTFDNEMSVIDFFRSQGLDIGVLMEKYNTIVSVIKENMEKNASNDGRGRGYNVKRHISGIGAVNSTLGSDSKQLSDLIGEFIGSLSLNFDKNIIFPNIYELLTVIQYLSSYGKRDKISISYI